MASLNSLELKSRLNFISFFDGSSMAKFAPIAISKTKNAKKVLLTLPHYFSFYVDQKQT